MLKTIDKYGENIGYIRFPFPISCYGYQSTVSEYYRITGAVPCEIDERNEEGCVIHLLHLRTLPPLIPMGATAIPGYTIQFQTDDFAAGITRLVIHDACMRCVVRYENDSSGTGWIAHANDKPRLKYFTDLPTDIDMPPV